MMPAETGIGNLTDDDLLKPDLAFDLSLDNFTSNYGFKNVSDTIWTHNHRIAYISVSMVMVSLCIIAFIINIRIVLSSKWIRRPLSPTISISISLALSDTCSAFLIALGFILNSLLPKGLGITINNECLFLVLEAFRLSGILVSTIHLLALAAIHYFGILWPFRSITWLTSSKLRIIIILIWLLPTAYIFSYFSSFENQAFQRADCHLDAAHNFLRFSRFRTIFSAIFFIPMVIMIAIYIHISVIVKRHQANRRWFNRHSRRTEETSISGSRHGSNRHLDRNVKAIWTSLLILSTYIICFMPAVLHFVLICNDCYYKFESVGLNNLIISSSIINFLLVAKYLLNPLIYASRMPEIQLAVKQMDAEWKRRLCTFGSVDELDRANRGRAEGSQRFSFLSSSSRRQNIRLASTRIQSRERQTRYNTTEV